MAAGKHELSVEVVGDREITLRRTFEASRELVWEAFTDPRHLTQWWGPHGFTTTVHALELRAGGAFDHTMHGPDGTNYPTNAVFTVVRKPERLAYTMLRGGAEGAREMTCEVEWSFEARGDQTRVTLRMRFPTAEAFAYAETCGIEAGGAETFERLTSYLARKRKERT